MVDNRNPDPSHEPASSNIDFPYLDSETRNISFARSQDVDLYQVTFARDSARPFFVELGCTARCVDFIDLNKNAQSF